MKINIFNRADIFENLEKYNEDLCDAWDTYNDYDGAKAEWWFDPRRYAELESTMIGQPRASRLRRRNQLDHNSIDYRLFMYPPNYLTLLLINLLYPNNKGILIEDACAGAGRLIYFLHKCGYVNFSIMEDFSQVTKFLLDGTLTNAGIQYVLNDYKSRPKVINIAGYPVYPKNHVPDSVELFVCYGNTTTLDVIQKLFKGNYVELCTDHNMISVAFCRRDKYDDFYKKIKPLEYKEG